MKEKYLLEKINDIIEINYDDSNNVLKLLKMDNDERYYTVPLYYSASKLLIGIITVGEINLKISKLKTENVIFLSKITNFKKQNKKKNECNIFTGILNYYEKLEKKTLDKPLVSSNTDNNKITWRMIIMNINNYLPRFNLLIKEKETINFFQNHPNQ